MLAYLTISLSILYFLPKLHFVIIGLYNLEFSNYISGFTSSIIEHIGSTLVIFNDNTLGLYLLVFQMTNIDLHPVQKLFFKTSVSGGLLGK